MFILTVLMIVVIVVIMVGINEFWRNNQFLIKGELLIGTVCGWNKSIDEDEGGRAYFSFFLYYHFLTPDGRKIRGIKRTWEYTNNAYSPPTRGTPVAILYVTDKLYELL